MPKGEGTAALWRDPAYRRRQIAAIRATEPWTSVDRAALSAAKKANWADPDYRARQSDAIRRGKAKSRHRKPVRCGARPLGAPSAPMSRPRKDTSAELPDLTT